ncbi:MAG: AraC family transcriptional regulator [Caldilinea sp.]|nr:AraC family transcriptional regulator [Caldilinea sp.]MDW8442035.1 AraC family transcriptional regulator [Caldilineaceae bacterium]
MVTLINGSELLNTISKVYRIALVVYDCEGEVNERFGTDPEGDEILFTIAPCKRHLLDLCCQTAKPHIISGEINQLWAGAPVLDGDRVARVIVLGPVYTSEFSKALAVDYVQSPYFSSQNKTELLAAVKQVPIYPYVEFAKLFGMICALFSGQEIDISSLTIVGLAKSEVALADKLHTYQEDHIERGNISQIAYNFEQHLLECIREGNLEGLKRLLKTTSYNFVTLGGENDPIRRQKNMFIFGVALATSAAIEGGLNPQIVYSLRDLYLQQIETMHNFPAILRLHREMLYEITSRVSNIKRTNRYSKLVNDCCNFIHEHVRESICVADIAAFVGYNPHYVSKKFREETGRSLVSYIKEAKIAEAKLLLRFSDLSLTEISELLSFSSQSYFTATFREVTGATPQQFRRDLKK